jgi:hypothetical protein
MYTYISPDPSTPWCTALNLGIGSQSSQGKSFPQCAEVLATGEDLVGLDDGIAGIEERRAACLELHAVEDKPGVERLA